MAEANTWATTTISCPPPGAGTRPPQLTNTTLDKPPSSGVLTVYCKRNAETASPFQQATLRFPLMYVDYAYVHAGYVIRAHGQALAPGEEYSTADKLAWLKQKVPAPWGGICTLKIQIGSSLGGDAIKQFKPRGITAIFIGVDQSRRYIVVTKTGKIHHSVDVSWNVKNCMQPLPLGAAGVVHHLWQSDGHIESGNTTDITNETFLEYYKDLTALRA